MLDARVHQGKFGEDYVRVLASGGLLVSQDDVDHDGIDLCIKQPGRIGSSFSPRIDVQVKTTSRPRRRAAVLDFDGLDQVQFNRLASADVMVPCYLFLIVVPIVSADYAALRTGGLLLREVGYYVSLRDSETFDEPRKDRKVRVRVPVANVLTVPALRRLLGPGGA
ncbi:hypothetical protein GCM10029976_010190 [Kribbella albertanoniae]